MTNSDVMIRGSVHWTLLNPDGSVAETGVSHNVQTQVGDQWMAERAGGVSGAPAAVTGMKLGTGTAVATKTGGGAALAAYLTNSHQALDALPVSSLFTDPLDGNKVKRRLTFTCSYPPGKATSAAAITEAVMLTVALTDATSAASATTHRALLSPAISSKSVDQPLSVVWNLDVYGV